ncbi:hypothetical protein B8V60_04800 [Streptococcus agalactiae]|nr:hypothetical protein B8U81_01340 [Streptococcus agalactiae]CCW39928.1 hypothetical protein MSA_10670 [Streptococcus agalactiae ILRI005]CCW42079.1 hypothetical protein SAIL_10620 [Streptococcus agalactiae ILRI112]KAF1108467.1 hypothetical protein B8V09_02100 [Streptococcus agalactiae]KAF1137803.1 hypothetical protein B8V14_08170 [Streptococcus agalactiae]
MFLFVNKKIGIVFLVFCDNEINAIKNSVYLKKIYFLAILLHKKNGIK